MIYDLKCANPGGMVSVKLVAEVGVGTVAAGVAKGNADEVLISGHDGGTGASPLSSIKHAGMPWEIGLAETQQTLVLNGLRDRIFVQCDGQMRTGRDVVIGALLGAERFGFGTSALVSLGCILMRKCHLGTCPVGIATQDPDLRKRFHGKPEYVVRFLTFVAEDVRRVMAELGFRKFDDMVGRVERLSCNQAIDHWKAKGLDFSAVFAQPDQSNGCALRRVRPQSDTHKDHLDWKIIEQLGPTRRAQASRSRLEMPIRNVHRTVGTILSNRIVKRHGGKGLPDGTFEFTFRGSAGQSFGAFLTRGVTLKLVGDANDYLGKGLSGGRIIVQTPPGSPFDPTENVIVGNTLLYGATSGEVFINGLTGERFAVRNSGAVAVVEGVGDHGCEYMTGGTVVVLGRTGRNFAAGMSGGIAYVLDEHQLFDTLCNLDMVDLEPVHLDEDLDTLQRPYPPPLPLDRQPPGEDDIWTAGGRCRAGSSKLCPSTTARPSSASASANRSRAKPRRARKRCSDNRTDPSDPSGPSSFSAAPKVHVWPTPPASNNSPAANCPTAPFRSGSRTGTKSTNCWSKRSSTSRPRAAWTAASPSATPRAAR